MTAKKTPAKPATRSAAMTAPKADAPKLVRMKRGEQFADVHPDEVENFAAGGWEEV